jgi:hypothetical protein
MPERFLWVNKSSSTPWLSRSGENETSTIFSFVQQRRRRREPVLQRSVSENSNRAVLRRSKRRTSLRAGSVAIEAAPDAQPQQHRHGREENVAVTVKPLNLRTGSCIDPFDQIVIPITKPLEAILRYYWKMVVTGGPNNKEEVLPPHVRSVQSYDAVREQAMREALSDRLALAGLLATMSARMVHMSKFELPGNVGCEQYIQSMIGLLRERIHDCQLRGVCAEPAIYLGIWRLALAECISGDFGAVRVHLLALRELLEHLTIDDPINRYVRVGIGAIDLFMAIETNSPDFVLPAPQSSIPRPDLEAIQAKVAEAVGSDQHLTASAFSRERFHVDAMMPSRDILADASATLSFDLGSSFAIALSSGWLPEHLRPVMTELLDIVLIAKYIWRTPHGTPAEASWMCDHAKLVLRALCVLPRPSIVATMSERRGEAIRLALVIMLSHTVTRYAFRSGPLNMRRLRDALSGIATDWSDHEAGVVDGDSIDPTSQSPAGEDRHAVAHHNAEFHPEARNPNSFLLWVLLTGHFAALEAVSSHALNHSIQIATLVSSQNAGPLESDEMFFRVRASFVASHHLGLKDAEDLHGVMEGFLYAPEMQKRSIAIVGLSL